jgi:hypothetical protein
MFKSTILLLLKLVALAYSAPLVPRQTHIGDATSFAPAVGACGSTNTAADLIVMVSVPFFNGL